MAVRIRMKQMGRTHRHYYRIVAIDHRQPRDGKVIEELGSYDPHVANKEERVKLVASRIKYWVSVGAKPSEHVQAFIGKYLAKFEQLEAQAAAEKAKAAAAAPAPAQALHQIAGRAVSEEIALPARSIRFDVLTLFPDLFQGYTSQSLLKLAIQRGLVRIDLWNIRDWSTNKHQTVDDRPFGGGPGMVLMAEPVVTCVEAVRAKAEPPGRVVMLTPAGRRLTQAVVAELAEYPRLILLCGRYEGFDDRIRQILDPLEISVGDFVCNGGEVPAMVVIDTVIRLIPEVLGDDESATDESHSSPGRIEYPQYTRPREFRGLEVPEVLLGGNHKAVAEWRAEQSRLRSERHQK